MIDQKKLGLFSVSPLNPYYVVEDKIWQAQPSRPSAGMRIVGTLTAWAKGLQQTVCMGILAKAWEHVYRTNELQFCIGRLIPYLKFLETGNEDSMLCSSDLEQMLSDVGRRAECLQEHLKHQSLQPISTDRLQEIFCTPCLVKLPCVIPLEPVGVMNSVPKSISVRYTHSVNRVKPLDKVIAEVEEEIRKEANCGGTINRVDNQEAMALMQDIDNIINKLQPLDAGHYKVIYFDRHHQLLYNCGRFVLVRGPVTHIRASQRFYVGLNIVGKTRREMFKIRPRVCKSPHELWTPDGIPTKGSMCMGNSQQYQRLFTDKLTDEEAVVEWLDTGVILSTGISALHRQRRQSKLKQFHRRQLYLKRVITK